MHSKAFVLSTWFCFHSFPHCVSLGNPLSISSFSCQASRKRDYKLICKNDFQACLKLLIFAAVLAVGFQCCFSSVTADHDYCGPCNNVGVFKHLKIELKTTSNISMRQSVMLKHLFLFEIASPMLCRCFLRLIVCSAYNMKGKT